ncbi:UrcA family protein [uncultured Sphingomonas sp.]|uniref:UrcA family protein n=1 Tax=uncultured Sphingomonas sp. TaxID=158754 RepID=UPI0025F64D15|nr:UrcA family protein [uncultured Sphingomonas sp.]
MNRFMAAAVAASLFMPVLAHAQVREPVSATAFRGDLDLNRADHRALLDARLNRAVARACGPVSRDLIANANVAQCRKEMRADAAVKIAALVAKPVALASNQ